MRTTRPEGAPRTTSPRRATAGIAVALILLGVVAGVGAYTFVYAEGASYLVDDPAACANCHVMTEQYDGWTKASHHAVATCNDCHTPHHVVGKYLVKALNGWNHSWAFTTGRFPEPIRITELNRAVTEGTCRHCHAAVVHAIDPQPAVHGQLACLRCHDSVGHLH